MNTPSSRARVEDLTGLDFAHDAQALANLILLENTEDLRWFRLRLSNRIREGINSSFLLQLKLLHAFTGHVLSKFGAV